MADQRFALAALDDAGLEGALRDLAPGLAFPSPISGPTDVAAIVRQRLVAQPPARGRVGLLGWLGRRPVRRSVLVAIAALLVLAAIAGAVGLGLPGIRINFGGATPSPSPSSSPAGTPEPAPSTPLGIAMGLGVNVPLDEAARLANLDLILPPDPAIGPPDEAYVLGNRAALVWSEIGRAHV